MNTGKARPHIFTRPPHSSSVVLRSSCLRFWLVFLLNVTGITFWHEGVFIEQVFGANVGVSLNSKDVNVFDSTPKIDFSAIGLEFSQHQLHVLDWYTGSNFLIWRDGLGMSFELGEGVDVYPIQAWALFEGLRSHIGSKFSRWCLTKVLYHENRKGVPIDWEIRGVCKLGNSYVSSVQIDESLVGQRVLMERMFQLDFLESDLCLGFGQQTPRYNY
ncbi:MAG: hypothetical protein ACKVRP_14745, partial [Bacteroidota bacterium]